MDVKKAIYKGIGRRKGGKEGEREGKREGEKGKREIEFLNHSLGMVKRGRNMELDEMRNQDERNCNR